MTPVAYTPKLLPLSALLLLLTLLAAAGPARAQKTIGGTVTDAATGQTLPSANIVIRGAYRGTITNRDGSYELVIPDSLLPATVQVRYIGYGSQERRITAGTARRQDFALQPSVTQMQELVVTGEDPAIRIMRRVIERKQQWRSSLQTYRAEAYTRQNLSRDTALVMITESASTIFWDKQRGPRELLRWRRQTANVEAEQNFAGVRYMPNFYDDNIDISGFEVVGVTHPDAFSYYDFELAERLTMDGQVVYRIRVIPQRDLQPLFRGEVFVLDGAYALLEVQLTPNSVVRFPPPVREFDLEYRQQFNNYGGDYWLPVDARIQGSVKVSMIGLSFPRFNIRQIARVSDYRVNVPLPDSLYDSEDMVAVDTAAAGDTLARARVERVPLSREEERAYATLDSTQTLEKAFRPSGFLARFIDFGEGDEEEQEAGGTARADTGGLGRWTPPGSFAPQLRYNRVDELFTGLDYTVGVADGLQLQARGGYSTGYGEWSYGGGARYRWDGGPMRYHLGAGYDAGTRTRYDSQIIYPVMASVSNLLGYENYFDYYRSEGYRLRAGLTHRRSDWGLEADFISRRQTALQTNSGYDILGRDRRPRINPPVDEGRMHRLGVTAGYNLQQAYGFGVTGRRRLALSVQWSGGALGSDFDFTRYAAHLDWSFPTFYQRRVFPNTLNISADAGTFSGQLPLQAFGIIDGTPGVLSLFEGLRTARFRPYEGEQYAVLNVEHNFRTIPFERLGLTFLVERNIGVVAFAGAGQTWVSDPRRRQLLQEIGYRPHTTDGLHLEAGLSLNGILNLFRVDFARRLDQPGFLVGVGITRFL